MNYDCNDWRHQKLNSSYFGKFYFKFELLSSDFNLYLAITHLGLNFAYQKEPI